MREVVNSDFIPLILANPIPGGEIAPVLEKLMTDGVVLSLDLMYVCV